MRLKLMGALLDAYRGKLNEGLRRARAAAKTSPDDEEIQSLLADLTFVAVDCPIFCTSEELV
jgi:hypothetical protein